MRFSLLLILFLMLWGGAVPTGAWAHAGSAVLLSPVERIATSSRDDGGIVGNVLVVSSRVADIALPGNQDKDERPESPHCLSIVNCGGIDGLAYSIIVPRARLSASASLDMAGDRPEGILPPLEERPPRIL